MQLSNKQSLLQDLGDALVKNLEKFSMFFFVFSYISLYQKNNASHYFFNSLYANNPMPPIPAAISKIRGTQRAAYKPGTEVTVT